MVPMCKHLLMTNPYLLFYGVASGGATPYLQLNGLINEEKWELRIWGST